MPCATKNILIMQRKNMSWSNSGGIRHVIIPLWPQRDLSTIELSNFYHRKYTQIHRKSAKMYALLSKLLIEWHVNFRLKGCRSNDGFVFFLIFQKLFMVLVIYFHLGFFESGDRSWWRQSYPNVKTNLHW